ncbi:MAG TPA: hypothetical protein VFE34_18710 [Dongiaceae bacterium]|jgi:hypothetical protein|nr:hypothetical protein [Dongiaceae bacterium]
MGQQEQRLEPDDDASLMRRARLRPLFRSIAACALALTLGLGQAYAGVLVDEHRGGGDGHDKEKSALVSERAGDREQHVAVAIHSEEDAATQGWTRTITRTFTRNGFVISVTKSKSVAFDEEGNRAVARAIARARAPNNVAAVRDGAGKIVAKASVDVTGNGAGSADAGGSIGVVGGGVKVSTWGRTSAEVF